MFPPQSNSQLNIFSGECEGRLSGSLAWRLGRGETTQLSEMAEESSKYTFKLSQKEEEKREFLVKYSVARDEYHRTSTTEGEEKEMLLKGWQAGMHSARNIFRKHEKDWKFVYLTRTGEGRKCCIQYISIYVRVCAQVDV